MLITNIEMVPGRKIVKHHGLVSGSTVRTKHVGRDIMAGLKNIFGGELKGYTELLTGIPQRSDGPDEGPGQANGGQRNCECPVFHFFRGVGCCGALCLWNRHNGSIKEVLWIL